MASLKFTAALTTAILLFTASKAFAASRVPMGANLEAAAICATCLRAQTTVADGSTRGLLLKINEYADIPRVTQSNVGKDYAFAPIGRIQTKNSISITRDNGDTESGLSGATAFMVSPCHILTNRHVVFGDAKPTLNGWSTTFSVGNDGNGHPTHVVDAAPAVLPADMGEGSDWTLLVMKPCIHDDKIGWMNIADLQLNQKVMMAGFPSDRTSALPTASKNCEIKVEGAKFVFTHSCSSHAGNSGSPIFQLDSNGVPSVLGIHYASADEKSVSLKHFDSKHPNLGIGTNEISKAIWSELQRGFAWHARKFPGEENPQATMARQYRNAGTQVAQNNI